MATNTTDSNDSSSSSSSSVVGWGYGYLIIETVHHFWDPEMVCYESRTSLSQVWAEYPDTTIDPQLVEWERLRAQGGS
jgi:serine protease inhibitor ecotin